MVIMITEKKMQTTIALRGARFSPPDPVHSSQALSGVKTDLGVKATRIFDSLPYGLVRVLK